MRKYRWPGNVRELRNVLERALVTCTGEALGKENLGLDFGKAAVSGTDDSLRLQAGNDGGRGRAPPDFRNPDVYREQQDACR